MSEDLKKFLGVKDIPEDTESLIELYDAVSNEVVTRALKAASERDSNAAGKLLGTLTLSVVKATVGLAVGNGDLQGAMNAVCKDIRNGCERAFPEVLLGVLARELGLNRKKGE